MYLEVTEDTPPQRQSLPHLPEISRPRQVTRSARLRLPLPHGSNRARIAPEPVPRAMRMPGGPKDLDRLTDHPQSRPSVRHVVVREMGRCRIVMSRASVGSLSALS
jgi:hypothetical protein